MTHEQTPSARKLRYEHMIQADTVAKIGDIATNNLETESQISPIIDAAKTAAQNKLNEDDAQRNKIVDENLDQFVQEADMDLQSHVLDKNQSLFKTYERDRRLAKLVEEGHSDSAHSAQMMRFDGGKNHPHERLEASLPELQKFSMSNQHILEPQARDEMERAKYSRIEAA